MLISISISSLNHFIDGLGLPLNLNVKQASCPSLTVIFSIFPVCLGGSLTIILNKYFYLIKYYKNYTFLIFTNKQIIIFMKKNKIYLKHQLQKYAQYLQRY